MSDTQVLILILTSAAVTALIRFLPFLIFGGGRKTPGYITYLAAVLPYAIIAMLVVYCFRNISFLSGSHGIPELIAGAAVVLLHIWRKNTLLSITAGTILYMFLIQVVF